MDEVFPTITGGELRALIREFGYDEARLIDTAAGTPLIQTELDGISFSVFLYDCRGGPPMACGGFGFSAGFDIPGEVDAAQLSNWNRQRRFGVAFADDQGVYLSLNVNIEGGVTRANIEDTLQLWEQALTDFADYIGWR
ncbi:MAG: YbjN domain-containing protein [Rhodospirillaceae bacterium]|nr:YbjN domain-containing protein [Rhodospirillaceae bacterium]MCA8934417.1 YbjN domain-containing protein [Rhodospirillaceae bacterium]